jgi:hypothetical protein
VIGPARVLRLERQMAPDGGVSLRYRVAEFRTGYTAADAMAGRVERIAGNGIGAAAVEGLWVGLTDWQTFEDDAAARLAFASGAWAPGKV